MQVKSDRIWNMSKFAIDDKYLESLDREFTITSYDEIYTAWLKARPYYVKGYNELILCDLTANARPTLTSVLNSSTPNQDNS